jgi:hypothetical protein
MLGRVCLKDSKVILELCKDSNAHKANNACLLYLYGSYLLTIIDNELGNCHCVASLLY